MGYGPTWTNPQVPARPAPYMVAGEVSAELSTIVVDMGDACGSPGLDGETVCDIAAGAWHSSVAESAHACDVLASTMGTSSRQETVGGL